ncbi:MAG TPA: CocE/NonD family hydrolase [Luteitalea sp.]|nr:CocE/NonD family hydrolase [Luteitalea sp.]
MRYMPHAFLASAVTLLCSLALLAQAPAPVATPTAKATYAKAEHMVPMRDGVKLYTAVYTPRTCPAGGAPILLQRTPYSSGPYGDDAYPGNVGPASMTNDPDVIVAYQDVRGRFLSEGEWEEVRPYVPSKSGRQFDESSDTYDSIDWLVKHVPCNNGRVGMWGISYPGFYALAALIDAHPALKAVSPQAPVTDYYLGDDSFHNGAFLLAHNFSFYVDFPPRGLQPRRPQPTKDFDYGTKDGYQFYLKGGSLADLTSKHGLTGNRYWTQNLEHTSYDDFWKARSIWRHLKGVTPAVLVVGGWFDAEDLSGPLRAFRSLREQSPSTTSHLVMGPWTHGGWARGDGSQVAQVRFGEPTSKHYREQIERRFFERHLRGDASATVPVVSIFETGSNRWRTFDRWPVEAEPRSYYLSADRSLSTTKPADREATDTYVSDPGNPVPGVAGEAIGMPRDYMATDQRFAAQRPDVLVYRSPVLTEDVTVLGPIGVRLHVATSGTDSDFVVKILDEYAVDDAQAGTQQLVRGEPFRGKFRRSLEKPVAFTPNVPDEIDFELPDVAHTFRRGHRIVVHVQSSWFPIFDRNPQTFTDIPNAKPEQFVKATQRIYRSVVRPSHIVLPVVR